MAYEVPPREFTMSELIDHNDEYSALMFRVWPDHIDEIAFI